MKQLIIIGAVILIGALSIGLIALSRNKPADQTPQQLTQPTPTVEPTATPIIGPSPTGSPNATMNPTTAPSASPLQTPGDRRRGADKPED